MMHWSKIQKPNTLHLPFLEGLAGQTIRTRL